MTKPENPEPGPKIAVQLKSLRAARHWSLDQMAHATGVSKAMLGQIERGESSPTVATLWKIAKGLDCPLSAFLSEPAPPAEVLLRSAAALRTQPASDDMLVAPLFPFEPRFAFELLELSLLPGYVRLSDAHAAGVTEFLTVLSGEADVLIDGVWHSLGPGDSVRFAADRPHGYRNLHERIAVCHNLIHYPPGAAGQARYADPNSFAD